MSDPLGPYDALEPPADRPTPASTREPGGIRVIGRGLRRRCPRCGSRRLFRGWFTIKERCPRCRLLLQREEGGFLGSMTLNYIVTVLVWVAVLVAWLAVDLPEVHVAALTAVSVAIAAIVPLAFYPTAKTIWSAVDYLVYRSTPEYAAEVTADRAQGNVHRSTKQGR